MAASQNQVVYLLFHDGERPNAFPFRYGFMVAALLVMLGYRAVAELRQTEAATAGRLLFRVTVFWLGALIVVVHFERSLMTPYLAASAALGLVLGALGIGLATGLRRSPRRVVARATALLAVIMVVDCGMAAAEESAAMKYPARGTWNVHPTPDWTTAMKSTAPVDGQFFRSDGVYVNFLNGLERSQNQSLRTALRPEPLQLAEQRPAPRRRVRPGLHRAHLPGLGRPHRLHPAHRRAAGLQVPGEHFADRWTAPTPSSSTVGPPPTSTSIPRRCRSGSSRRPRCPAS